MSSLLSTSLKLILSKNKYNFFKNRFNLQKFVRVLSNKAIAMDDLSFSLMCRQLAPPLTSNRHKGQAGKVGVIGGSLEYTGAPYFSAISALKVGADMVHVFCQRDAAIPIKSYSPELIVHPLLDDPKAIEKIEPWLSVLHVVLIGPGLGREASIFKVIESIIDICRAKSKPMVMDADALYFIAHNNHVLNDFPAPGVILTPNVMEYARLLGAASPKEINPDNVTKLFLKWGSHVTILNKGEEVKIIDISKTFKVSGGGSGRRCGGQGDILGGALSIFYAWALEHKLDIDVPHDDRAFLACYAACRLVRECNERVFKKKGRSMLASDMIEEIHPVFEDLFEQK